MDVDGCFTSISSTRVVLSTSSSQKKNHRQENKMKVPSRILASSEYIPSACLQISFALGNALRFVSGRFFGKTNGRT